MFACRYFITRLDNIFGARREWGSLGLLEKKNSLLENNGLGGKKDRNQRVHELLVMNQDQLDATTCHECLLKYFTLKCWEITFHFEVLGNTFKTLIQYMKFITALVKCCLVNINLEC